MTIAKRKNFKRVFVILIIMIFLSIIAFSTNAILKRLVYNIGNYDVNIRVEDDIKVDYSMIEKDIIKSDGTHIHWFNSLKERHQLMDYMKDNDLIIKPGFYRIKAYASFEEIKEILVFEKNSDNNKGKPSQ